MDTKRLDLNLLQTLEALLEEGNVTRAAARLHLSQPAVSAQLARLRAQFGDPLLIPAPRGMRPTAKAEALLAPLRDALRQVRDMLASHQDFDPATAHMTLNIACTDYAQAVAVIPLLRRLREAAPGIRVAVRNLEPARLQAQTERGEVDLALISPDCAPDGLHARFLFDDRYVLIGRHGHPALQGEVTLEHYLTLEHVVVSLGTGDFSTTVDAALAERGVARRVALSAASFLLVPEIVAQTDCVALLPERLALACRERVQLRECPFPLRRFDVAMAWHERSHGHPGLRWLRGELAGLMGVEV
ncbi:LysR family transcriptional regulator [Chromobacterium phragmitis]|uniref:LysR family transcriptional regulator n=1 Tax=Chromobacterium amazonense TaxID=1382803 RepID=UPI0021B7E0C9|nr:LysR family transcriptional regulator [Chromobacterium amazonense]MBM2885695.1 LysR family transcriptional regulator [Chromobacterium amazonense]MDE1716345.1 LysR family transcriptional regulator [Chromobacterium amazonense]